MNEIDPVEYGKLLQAVGQLERDVKDLKNDVRELLELANQSRGGLWTGMAVAATFGSALTWFMQHFVFNK